jgi:hypothetical protein
LLHGAVGDLDVLTEPIHRDGPRKGPFGAALSVAARSCAVPTAAGPGAGSLAITNAPAVTGGAQRGHGHGHSAVPIADGVEPARTRKPSNHITVRPTPEWLTILQQAGMDLMAYNGAKASDAAGPLAQAAQRMGGPGTPHPLRPAGQPPAGAGVAELLQWAAEKCAQRPNATFRVQIRDARSTR